MTGLASSSMVATTWVLLGIYSAAVIFFVIRGALKTKSIDDYGVGSIAFSPTAVGLSLAASMMSAATFVINPGLIAHFGVSGILSFCVVLPIATLTSLIIMTKGFRKHGNVVKATTLAQWIGSRYKSPGFSLFFAFLSFLLVTFIVLICVGLTKVVSKSLNIGELYVLIGIVVFIFGYMMFGGANSMVYTNTIQACLMLVVAFILIGSGYEHFSNGVHGFLEKLRAIDPNLASSTNPSSPLFRDYFEIVFCQIVVGMAIVCQPHILTKSLFLKSDKDVNRYLIVGSIVVAIFFAVVVVGLYARLAFPDLTVNGAALKSDGIVSAYVIGEFPVWVGIILVMGLIAAGISTLEGLIQSVSTMMTADLVRPVAIRLLPVVGRSYPAEGERRARLELWTNRAVIGLLGIVAVWISWGQLVSPDLSVAILAQNGVYAYFAAAFVPVLFGTFMKNVPKYAPMVASLTAIVVHFTIYYGRFTSYMQTPTRNPGVPAAIAICLSVTAGLAVLFAWKLFVRPKDNPGRESKGLQAT
jgi:sodium/pantothenate symporter